MALYPSEKLQVIPNPSGTPTNTMSTVEIAGTIYKIVDSTLVIQIPSVVGDTFTYNGSAQGPTITGLDTAHCNVSGATATNAGTYTLTISLKDPVSTKWADETFADKTYSYTINKASQTITASKNSVSLTYGSPSDTVTITNNATALTATSSDTSVATVSAEPHLLTISRVGYGNTNVTVYANSTSNYEQSNTITISVASEAELVSWVSGTDAQIADMINAYYDGEYTLNDIKSVWSVGQTRKIPIGAISATGGSGTTAWSVGESHSAKNAVDGSNWVEIEIIDFDHDLLTTAINGKTKSLLTVQTKDCLMADNCNPDSGGSTNTENGYMNSSSTNEVGWNNCARRSWCNNGFYNALPNYIRDLIKEVYKSTAASGNTSSPTWVANIDKCFFLSEYELMGTSSISAEDGTDATHYVESTSGSNTITMQKGGLKYIKYSSTSDRYKKPIWASGMSSDVWWLRSPNKSNGYGNANLDTDGQVRGAGVLNARGLSPAWCM